nr:hypothetical protein [Tanacetum cinerariifolium]
MATTLANPESILSKELGSVALNGGRLWRVFGCIGVTKGSLEALELKGGDGGTCKVLGWLLGDVMVMQERKAIGDSYELGSVALNGGRLWRVFGCIRVTKGSLEALELKGGDGGACKVLGWLLGDVMVMQERNLQRLISRGIGIERYVFLATTIQNAVELAEYINTLSWNRPIVYYDDDDEDYTILITLVLPTEEPDNSLSIGDKHLDTNPATESEEVIKSRVEDLVPIPSDSEGIPDNMCDVSFRDNSPPLDISKDQFKDFSDFNVDSPSIDDNSFSIDDFDYVEASPPHSELISLEEVKNFHPKDRELEDDDGDSFLKKFETIPKLETFKFDIEEKNSGSTTIHADISLSDLECFYFKSGPDLRDLTSIIDLEICENVSSTTNANLPFEDDQSPLFTYVVWIFLHFLTYPVAPPYILSSGNEDIVFDPGISIYHSFMPGVSHRSGTFMKFNVYPNHLNESPMEILSSTCFLMAQ